MTDRQRVVIVGAGFAGFTAARHLSRLARGAIEIVLINPTDYFLYLPLLPEVAAGMLDPRRVAVSLAGRLPGRPPAARRRSTGSTSRGAAWSCTDAEGQHRELGYDRLVVTVGSVNKLLPVPGVAEHAHGFRSIAEALYLRDHLIRQIELADASDDAEERDARLHVRRRRRRLHRHGGRGAGRAAHRRAVSGTAPGCANSRPLAAGRPGPAHPARAGPAAVGHGAPDAARARRRGPHRHHRVGGDRRRGQALRRRVRAHPLADLVRGRPPRPAGGGPGAADRAGPAARRRVPHGPGPSGDLRLRRRGGRARPDPARRVSPP